jgi:hypothetical protein
MTGLLGLSTELLLHVASFVPQSDLLSIALSCMRLRTATEPELYREYVHSRQSLRSFIPFLRQLCERPELAKYVHRLELRPWSTLPYMPRLTKLEWERVCVGIVEPIQETEYSLFTTAAKSIGIITSALGYEVESSLLRKANCPEYIERYYKMYELDSNREWYDDLFEDEIDGEDVSFDIKFCKFLRAGIEEPLAILLMELCPNVKVLHLPKVGSKATLQWPSPHHGFHALRKLTAASCSNIEIIATAFQSKRLKVLELCSFQSLENHVSSSTKTSFTDTVSNHISRLVLVHAGLSRSEMATLLKSCHKLRSLYLSSLIYYPEYHSTAPPAIISAPELVHLLLPHKDNLKELHVDLSPTRSSHSSSIWCSLANFRALETFSTSNYDIISTNRTGTPSASVSVHNSPFDQLPCSLKHFMIIYHAADPDHTRSDASLVASHLDAIHTGNIKLPHLRTLTLAMQDGEDNLAKDFPQFRMIQHDSRTGKSPFHFQVLKRSSLDWEMGMLFGKIEPRSLKKRGLHAWQWDNHVILDRPEVASAA